MAEIDMEGQTLGVECGRCGGEVQMNGCPEHHWVLSSDCKLCGLHYVVAEKCQDCDYTEPADALP